MIDHISLHVTNFSKAVSFYTAALAPLGYERQYFDEASKSAGFGPPKRGSAPWIAGGSLWIAEGKPSDKQHLALRSPSRKAVGEFHAAALNAGGKDNGEPGLRADYHPTYYA